MLKNTYHFHFNNKKVTRIDKKGKESIKTISYILQITDSAGFMARSFSNLFNNLAKDFIKINVNMDIIINKHETCEINYKDCECFLEYANFIDDIIVYNYLSFNKNYQKRFDEIKKKKDFPIHKNFLTMILIHYSPSFII